MVEKRNTKSLNLVASLKWPRPGVQDKAKVVTPAMPASRAWEAKKGQGSGWSNGGGGSLGQVECTLSFLDGDGKPLLQDADVAVVGQLEVVHARHDTGEIVIRRVRRLARAANDGEKGSKTLEACIQTR